MLNCTEVLSRSGCRPGPAYRLYLRITYMYLNPCGEIAAFQSPWVLRGLSKHYSTDFTLIPRGSSTGCNNWQNSHDFSVIIMYIYHLIGLLPLLLHIPGAVMLHQVRDTYEIELFQANMVFFLVFYVWTLA